MIVLFLKIFKKPPVDRMAPSCSFGLEGETGRHVIIYQFIGYGQRFGWMVMDLDITWKIVDKEIWGRSMWIDFSEWGKMQKYLCPLKGDLSKG